MSIKYKTSSNSIKHDETKLIFVYGSLKQGFSNHHIIEKATYQGRAQTKKRYGMFQEENANYPYLINKCSPKYHHIEGELYEIQSDDILKQIDKFEDAPEYYQRETIDIKIADGKIKKAQSYFLREGRIPLKQTPLREWTEDNNFYIKQFDSYYKKATAVCA